VGGFPSENPSGSLGEKAVGHSLCGKIFPEKEPFQRRARTFDHSKRKLPSENSSPSRVKNEQEAGGFIVRVSFGSLGRKETLGSLSLEPLGKNILHENTRRQSATKSSAHRDAGQRRDRRTMS